MKLALDLCDIGIDATFITTSVGLIIHSLRYFRRLRHISLSLEAIKHRLARKVNVDEVEKIIKENILPLQIRLAQAEKILDEIIVIQTKKQP